MEFIRRLVRRFVRTNSRIYQTCAYVLDFVLITKQYNLKTFSLLSKASQKSQQEKLPISVKFSNLLHPIQIRPGTDDARTIIDNIIREEWGKFEPEGDVRWLIDAGAYIGDSSAYFLSRFPTLSVIALEPDSFTFGTMVKNLAPYGSRVRTINSGLYSYDGTVRFQGGQTAASIAAEGECEIPVRTMMSLLKEASISRLDILKLDIEGAEETLFASNPEEWLKYVDWLLIEFHSDLGESSISQILKQHGFSMRQYRSVWYCKNMAQLPNNVTESMTRVT